jgi:hypothetical protein
MYFAVAISQNDGWWHEGFMLEHYLEGMCPIETGRT